jgi:hypothetical protein
MPVGSEVEYIFRLDGYQEMRAGGVVTEEGLVIEPILKIYSPPQEGDPWEDIFGQPYGWENDVHVGHYHVGERVWRRYERAAKRKDGQIIEVTENGERRRIVLATPGQAERFIQWLEDQCRDGYLTEDHVMEARIDSEFDLSGVNPEAVSRGMKPFHAVVREIPYARVMIDSVPGGALVYLNGTPRGFTPLLGLDEAEPGVKVEPGTVELILEAVGFNRYKTEFVLEPRERWEQPKVYQLEPTAESKAVVFGKEWENGLGMKFVPSGEDLMVGIWEVRVRDYQRFLDGQKKVKPPPAPDFPRSRSPDHPVVQVTRAEAQEFCRWLTDRERREKRIAENDEYRLPTDLEWSVMAGLEGELGDWPQERAEQLLEGYPWGLEWPPPRGAGNFADEEASGAFLMLDSQTIEGFNDGFAATAPVGSFDPNPLGIYDLAGNVYEWVHDNYNSYSEGQQLYGVTRGGGWNSYQPGNLRTSARNPVVPDRRGDYYGFRVVLAKNRSFSDKSGGESE